MKAWTAVRWISLPVLMLSLMICAFNLSAMNAVRNLQFINSSLEMALDYKSEMLCAADLTRPFYRVDFFSAAFAGFCFLAALCLKWFSSRFTGMWTLAVSACFVVLAYWMNSLSQWYVGLSK